MIFYPFQMCFFVAHFTIRQRQYNSPIPFKVLRLSSMHRVKFMQLLCCSTISCWDFCKVEFNQPSCWLYSVPSLLVFQHLETLYLGGNHARVVCVRECEELLKCVQRSRDSQLDFTSGSQLQAIKLKHTCQACQKLKCRAN